jgi:DNA-binding beta-propeller fold protein YncE
MKVTRGVSHSFFFGGAMLLVGPSHLTAQATDPPALILESKIGLGKVSGRIDHMAFDPTRNRLFVAELGNNTVGVVDINERKVAHRMTGLSEPQGIGYETSTDTVYVANGGDGSVRIYRAADYMQTGRINLGGDADNVRIDPARNRVLVGYGSGAIAAIDTTSRDKTAQFSLPAHPESFQIGGKTGQIFVNVPNSRAIILLDGATGQTKATWPTRNATGNFPMALDEEAQRILVAFRYPTRLQVFSISNGENVGNVELCGDSDDIFLDAKRHRLYASCGQGVVDVIDATDGGYRRMARLPTAPGARTSYFVPSIDRLLVAVRATTAEPAAIWVFRPEP